MAKPLSPDLRLRIVRAVEVEGMSCRGAAGRFGVAPSTAIELVSEWRSTGSCEAAVQGGDRRSARIESHAAEILALVEATEGKIGTLSSSRRYKEEIKCMSNASEALYALKPVSFRYKKKIDPTQALSFGLIAEEVAQISSALITRDKAGRPETVRYEAINAMLLNEFLKEHRKGEDQDRKIQEQETAIAELRSEIRALAATVDQQASELRN